MSILPVQSLCSLSSARSLIAANLLIIVLASIYEWSLLDIILTFWIENVFIGFFNIPKIIMAKKEHPGHRPDTIGSKTVLILFFA